MNEFEEHIKEYETEYRWLARFYEMPYDHLIKYASMDKKLRLTVEIMKQYHYDQCHE